MVHTEALLESWMRRYYFATDIDIGSSGVESFSLGELRTLLGIHQEELDRVVFDDSMTLGGVGLRQAIADRWADGDGQRVMATHGSSEAIYLSLNALLQAGDEVLILEPLYQQFFSIAEAIGCRLKPWPLRAEQQFRPNVEEARSLIGPRTRMIIVNFPHNPTGVTLTRHEQENLVSAAAEVGAYLLWDAAFADLTYDQGSAEPRLPYERAISLGTLSKAYGLPGLRVGWCVAATEVLERCERLRDYITLHLSPLVELIAQKAIEKSEVLLAIRRRQARTNLEILAAWVEQHRGAVEWARPQGGVCAFLRLCSVADTEALCHQLAHEHSVLLVPGACFNCPEHVRLGFGGPTSDLKEGLARLSGLLKNYRRQALTVSSKRKQSSAEPVTAFSSSR
jgi:capreomycidine synthase